MDQRSEEDNAVSDVSHSLEEKSGHWPENCDEPPRPRLRELGRQKKYRNLFSLVDHEKSESQGSTADSSPSLHH